MGRLNKEQENIKQSAFKHFTHGHPLESATISETSPLVFCCICSLKILPSHKGFFTCKICPFALHSLCYKLPRKLLHPADPNHDLILGPSPSFQCKACGYPGSGFSYTCKICSHDYHSLCTTRPLSITCSFHDHPLNLEFSPPYGGENGFSCDACNKPGEHHWVYHCKMCEFDVHLNCAASDQKPAAFKSSASASGSLSSHCESNPTHVKHGNNLINEEQACGPSPCPSDADGSEGHNDETSYASGMERLKIEEEEDEDKPVFKHISHDHPVEFAIASKTSLISCSRCSLTILPGKGCYTCRSCPFALHYVCHKMPKRILHAAEPDLHYLFLISLPSFECKACGNPGSGITYKCNVCSNSYHGLYLHKPLSLSCDFHPHILKLEFSPPDAKKSFQCSICQKTGANHWFYQCEMCEFYAHLDCAITKQETVVQIETLSSSSFTYSSNSSADTLSLTPISPSVSETSTHSD